ncbi:hypothetical protein DIE01_16390 [Burkholderia sp. Bp8990]|nr:hypothetical protein DIE01_16390 [Burkholderia sp. Bp8990]
MSDYGQRARTRAALTPNESDPLLAHPQISAMFELMEEEGHTMDGVRKELEKLTTLAGMHVTQFRSLEAQVNNAKAAHITLLASGYNGD